MKTINAAANNVGMDSLITIWKNLLTPLHPRFALASIRLLSILRKAPFMYMKTRGKNFRLWTSKIPLKP